MLLEATSLKSFAHSLIYEYLGKTGVKLADFCQSRDGQQNKDKTVGKHKHKGVCVCKAETETYGVYEKCVKSHAACLSKGKVGEKAYEHGSENRRNCGGNIDCAVGNPEGI